MTLPTPRTNVAHSRLNLWLVVAVCLAPVVLSYLFYYGVRPEGRTNHGDLLSPQAPVAALSVQTLRQPAADSGFLDLLAQRKKDGQPTTLLTLGDLQGRWLMVRVGSGQCDDTCQQQLIAMRQVRLTTGRDRDRVERVWLVTDDAPVQLPSELEGTWVFRVQPAQLAGWTLEAGSDWSRHIWLIDPLGNLMMRFPSENDPGGLKKDLLRLLKASRVG